jgi:hypothetical protein
MADGCVSETGRITLALQARDHGHIREWLKFLGTPERPVNTKGGKARAQVSSPRLAQALAHHGVVVRKTDAGVATSDEAAKHPAFWRGMIDGDGNITLPSGKHGPSVGLCGSRVLMEQYADFLATAVLDGFRPRVLAVHGTTVIHQVKVEGRRARAVAEALWAETEVISHADMRDDARLVFGPTLARKRPRVRAAVAWRTRTELGEPGCS